MDLFEAYDNGFSSETNLISPHVIISDATHVYAGLRLLHSILLNDLYACVYCICACRLLHVPMAVSYIVLAIISVCSGQLISSPDENRTVSTPCQTPF